MPYSIAELERCVQLYNQGVAIFKTNRQNSVERKSPYSKNITLFIQSIQELNVYTGLNLTEAILTRPTLLLDIDPLYKNKDGVTNLERMLTGKAPIDAVTGDIVHLHHIGQQYNSPFAELPQSAHSSAGQYSKLHMTNTESWRNNSTMQRKTYNEIKQYWIMRGKKLYEGL